MQPHRNASILFILPSDTYQNKKLNEKKNVFNKHKIPFPEWMDHHKSVRFLSYWHSILIKTKTSNITSILDCKAVCWQLRVVLHHHSIIHHGRYPPLLEIPQSRLTFGHHNKEGSAPLIKSLLTTTLLDAWFFFIIKTHPLSLKVRHCAYSSESSWTTTLSYNTDTILPDLCTAE